MEDLLRRAWHLRHDLPLGSERVGDLGHGLDAPGVAAGRSVPDDERHLQIRTRVRDQVKGCCRHRSKIGRMKKPQEAGNFPGLTTDE